MRRVPPLVLVALAASLLAPPALAQQGPQQITLLMDDAGGNAFFFRLPDSSQRNPTLQVAAGATVLVRATNDGTVDHNLHFGAPIGVATPCCQAPGESTTLEVRVPSNAPASVEYWCTVHADEGMRGVVRVASADGIPTIKFQRPAANAVVPPEFSVVVTAENFTLGVDGHVHYIVNGTRGLPGWDTANTTFRVRAVGSGYHYLRVELVGPDHEPLDPPVVQERIVFVDPNAPPDPDPTLVTPTVTPTPEDGEDDGGFLGIPAPGLALVLVLVSLAARAASAPSRSPWGRRGRP